MELSKVKNSDSKKSNDLIFIRNIKANLNQTLQDLQNKIWLETPELTRENLKAQYEFQKEILIKAGLLKKISTGELGIEAIDKQEYPIPTLEQIEERMLEKRELLETKIPQGFVKLIIVPFGLPISSLIDAYSNALMENYQQGKLLDTQGKLLELDGYVGGRFIDNEDTKYYIQAEATGELVYFPKEFSDDHQGKTKQELLPTQAWQVLLLEDLPNLPFKGKGKTIANRQQPESDQTPDEYLKQLQTDPQYKGEQGLTPESWLVYGLSHLEQTNQVIDNSQGLGKSCNLLNSCFVKPVGVPYAYFYRSHARVELDENEPTYSSPRKSVRFAVSIF